MPIFVGVKHGEVRAHDGMIDALTDYIDCIDAKKVKMWWCPSEPDEYTDAEALRDLTDFVAAFTSGIKGAIAESDDQDIAQEALQFIEALIQRRNEQGIQAAQRLAIESELFELNVKDQWTRIEVARNAELLQQLKEMRKN